MHPNMHVPYQVGTFEIMIQLGNVVTNDLIAFLALERELQFFIVLGAWFHMCMASFVNVFSLRQVTLLSISWPEDLALVFITSD